MRKYTELNLVNLANNMLGLHKITHDCCQNPHQLFIRMYGVVTDEIMEMSPEKLGQIAFFAIADSDAISNSDLIDSRCYRKMAFSKIRPAGSKQIPTDIGPGMLMAIVEAVVIGTMYEILATERVLRFGKEAGVDYDPLPKLVEFVAATRLREFMSDQVLREYEERKLRPRRGF